MNSPWLVARCPVLAIALATLGGCGQDRDAILGRPPLKLPPAYPELGITVDNYPKVDGSTSAQPLLTIVACKVLGADYEWGHSEIHDTRNLWASDLLESINNPAYHFEKQSLCRYINDLCRPNGTHQAYVN